MFMENPGGKMQRLTVQYIPWTQICLINVILNVCSIFWAVCISTSKHTEDEIIEMILLIMVRSNFRRR